MPTPARRTAFEILLRVETQASYAAELLHSPATESFSPREAALATELVLGTLRWQAQLDFIGQQLIRKKWASLDAEVRTAVRLGLYQLRFLTRMPARAAIHETVELVKSAGKRSAAGLVNAVLRKGGTADLQSFRPPSFSELEWQSIEWSHPSWLLDRWNRRYGSEAAAALARANNQPPTTFLRMSSWHPNRAAIEAQLEAKGIQLRPGKFLKECRAVARGNVTQTVPYRRGEVAIQDEASQIIPYLLDVREGDHVLDLCAAPGNKTAQLAEGAGTRGWVVASDVHWHRLREMPPLPPSSHTCRVALDGCQPLPFSVRFDRILLDAPCSGTGTLGRHPEIKWRLSPMDIRDLSKKQLALLENAAVTLKVGGRMVYSTCSLEKEENQEVIAQFLAAHGEFKLLPIREDSGRLQPFFHPSSAWVLAKDFLETFPPRDGTDGFFAAVLVKIQETTGP